MLERDKVMEDIKNEVRNHRNSTNCFTKILKIKNKMLIDKILRCDGEFSRN